jgi:stage V sporulation protein SpoVS
MIFKELKMSSEINVNSDLQSEPNGEGSAVLRIKGMKDSEGGSPAVRDYIHRVAGAIAKEIEKKEEVKMKAVGVLSINNALKAYIVAREFVKKHGDDIGMIANFDKVEFGGVEKTGVTFTVFTIDQDGAS